jgi:hypothetical protein
LLEWDDDAGSPDFFVGIETGAGDHLDDSGVGSKIIAAGGTLYIGVLGEESSFDITNSGVEMKAPRWIVDKVGPHAWGQPFAGNDRQFEFAGNYTGGGFSAQLRKFLVSGALTGFAGDIEGLFGLQVAPSYITQTAVEDIDLIAGINIPIAAITDNLTGSILETAGLHVEGPMVGGVDNYAVLAPAGVSKFDQILAGPGPHSFGSAISAPTQYGFRGDYTFPGSFGVKVLIRDSLIGESGADEMRYLRVLPKFQTQAAAESLSILAGMTVGIPSITDLLTGGGTIGEVVTLEVSGASALGVDNWALRVRSGLSEFDDVVVDESFLVAETERVKQNFPEPGVPGGFVNDPNLQTLGVGGSASRFSAIAAGRWSDDDLGPSLVFGKSRATAIGSNTVVADDDQLGAIAWGADDGNDFYTIAAMIEARVNDASPASSSIGGQLILRVARGLAANDITEALRLEADLSTHLAGDLQHNGAGLGFYSTAAVARPTGVAVTDVAIHAALVTLGLITA